jgi:hypothetical protein
MFEFLQFLHSHKLEYELAQSKLETFIIHFGTMSSQTDTYLLDFVKFTGHLTLCTGYLDFMCSF